MCGLFFVLVPFTVYLSPLTPSVSLMNLNVGHSGFEESEWEPGQLMGFQEVLS